MGCGGSEEKKEEAKVTVAAESSETTETVWAPVILSIQNKWKEGKTKEDVVAIFKKVSEAAMGVPGVISFQYAIDEEAKTSCLTEIYKDAAVIGAFQEAGKETVGELLETIETTSLKVSGPKAQLDMVAPGLAAFSPELYYTDAFSKGGTAPGDYDKPEVKLAAAPLIHSITNKWQEGKTKEDVVKMFNTMMEFALSQDGIYCFQYGIDEEKRISCLTEIFKDAATLGAFQAAGSANVGELLATIETTSVAISGPKEQVDGYKEGMAPFNPSIFDSAELGPAMKF